MGMQNPFDSTEQLPAALNFFGLKNAI